MATEIRKREQKEPSGVKPLPPAAGNLGAREVRLGYCEYCTQIMEKIGAMLLKWLEMRRDQSFLRWQEMFLNIAVNQSEVDRLTAKCERGLKGSNDHQRVLREWVVAVYDAHGITLPCKADHVMDMATMDEADKKLNPILLGKISKLMLDSARASLLLSTAKETGAPLSKLVFKDKI